jgi:hypothetical protein
MFEVLLVLLDIANTASLVIANCSLPSIINACLIDHWSETVVTTDQSRCKPVRRWEFFQWQRKESHTGLVPALESSKVSSPFADPKHLCSAVLAHWSKSCYRWHMDIGVGSVCNKYVQGACKTPIATPYINTTYVVRANFTGGAQGVGWVTRGSSWGAGLWGSGLAPSRHPITNSHAMPSHELMSIGGSYCSRTTFRGLGPIRVSAHTSSEQVIGPVWDNWPHWSETQLTRRCRQGTTRRLCPSQVTNPRCYGVNANTHRYFCLQTTQRGCWCITM